MSRRLCETRDIAFLDLTHTDKVDPKRFWAVDGFHPGTFLRGHGRRHHASAV